MQVWLLRRHLQSLTRKKCLLFRTQFHFLGGGKKEVAAVKKLLLPGSPEIRLRGVKKLFFTPHNDRLLQCLNGYFFKLAVIKICIETILRNQFVVGSGFDDIAFIHNEN